MGTLVNAKKAYELMINDGAVVEGLGERFYRFNKEADRLEYADYVPRGWKPSQLPREEFEAGRGLYAVHE